MTVFQCLLESAGAQSFKIKSAFCSYAKGSCLQNLCCNAATPFHNADVKNLKSDKRVKKTFGLFSDVLRSVATEVVAHQLAVLETCGRGIALITVSQTSALCDRSRETQAGDLGPTFQLRVDLP